ncbi:hypothetical protein HZS_2924 [Henneguya salminicola]|nr:hypothetical protein HZS_2924 [Henneguya salminicola]
MINESLQLGEDLKSQIIWFTSMIGCKKTMPKLIDYIEQNSPPIQSYQEKSFTQGKKTRWFLAWSFVADVQKLKNTSNITLIKMILST